MISLAEVYAQKALIDRLVEARKAVSPRSSVEGLTNVSEAGAVKSDTCLLVLNEDGIRGRVLFGTNAAVEGKNLRIDSPDVYLMYHITFVPPMNGMKAVVINDNIELLKNQTAVVFGEEFEQGRVYQFDEWSND